MKPEKDWWTPLASRLAEGGMNVFGVAGAGDFDALLPGCRSVLVFGSGGGALWGALLADLLRAPAGLTDQAHPLDAFARRQIEAADALIPASVERRWIRAAADEQTFVDFRPLCLAAGLGHHSLLGLLLHPVYGPWMGLRAACFTTEAIPATGPTPGPSPCERCPAPCIAACHGLAMSRGGLDIRACAAFHVETGDAGPCAERCDARGACPQGASHAYPELELRYHYSRRSGRQALADHLGIPVGQPGSGPYWADWG